MGFDDVSADKCAAAIAVSVFVFGVLEKYDCFRKLVAQTHKGACVMASGLNGVQAKIKVSIPEAMFTHCYVHELNTVLSLEGFFKTVEGLATFFSNSTKRTHLMDVIVKQRLPRAVPTKAQGAQIQGSCNQ